MLLSVFFLLLSWHGETFHSSGLKLTGAQRMTEAYGPTVTVSPTSLCAALLQLKKQTYTFCIEDLSFETVTCQQRRWDTTTKADRTVTSLIIRHWRLPPLKQETEQNIYIMENNICVSSPFICKLPVTIVRNIAYICRWLETRFIIAKQVSLLFESRMWPVGRLWRQTSHLCYNRLPKTSGNYQIFTNRVF